MSYRLLDINGVEYGFIIGTAVLKIKGPKGSVVVRLSDFLKMDHLEWTERVLAVHLARCDCCQPPQGYDESLAITPAKIRAYILENLCDKTS